MTVTHASASSLATASSNFVPQPLPAPSGGWMTSAANPFFRNSSFISRTWASPPWARMTVSGISDRSLSMLVRLYCPPPLRSSW